MKSFTSLCAVLLTKAPMHELWQEHAVWLHIGGFVKSFLMQLAGPIVHMFQITRSLLYMEEEIISPEYQRNVV
jgi:hypothetical protein